MLKFHSPAKVNLTLRIVGKRPDGYHNLQSIFQAVSLYDTLSFSFADKDRLTANVAHLPLNKENLILKAKDLFSRRLGKKFGIAVHLEKHIPDQAGLGGGSSNAATTLFALNSLFSVPFTEKQLAEMGSEVGSDVPFFFAHGKALCEGRGEVVKEMDEISSCPFWIFKPPFGLSTPEVFKRFRMEDSEKKRSGYFNDLETSAFLAEPRLLKIKEDLLERGFSSVHLTGSGTAFVAFGEGCTENLSLVKKYFVHPIKRMPLSWYESRKD